MTYRSTTEIMEEINRLTPSYAGITHARLEASHGLQWPCPGPDHPGTTYLHRDRFAKGRGSFLPCDFKPVAETPDEEYDFLLTTGRIYFHYHTGTMSRRIDALAREAPEAKVEIHRTTPDAWGSRTATWSKSPRAAVRSGPGRN